LDPNLTLDAPLRHIKQFTQVVSAHVQESASTNSE